MFWLGDSAMGWRYNLKRYPGEIIQGIKDNIPVCCALYYTFIKTICLIVHALRNPKFVLKGFRTWCESEGKKPLDGKIFTMFTDAYRKSNGDVFSPSFQKLDYWRCPICRIIDRQKKLNWTTGSFWDYCYYDNKSPLEIIRGF